MMTRWLLTALLLLLPTWAQAATKYISATGSNSNNGTSTSLPYLTWAHAFTNTSCGDTLTVMDGTYTPGTHGTPNFTKVCTVGTPYTIRALNERVPLIAGTGSTNSFKATSAAYLVVDGLRIKSADLSSGSGGNAADVVSIVQSHHVTLKNLIVSENNRYFNTHLILLNNSTSGNPASHTIEDVELYSFHRHGVLAYYSDVNVIRRLYCHSRSRANIAGGWASFPATQGDSCVAIYPGNDNILENVIAESALSIVEINASASGKGRRNRVLGSIALGDRSSTNSVLYGVILDNRGNTSSLQVQDTTLRHNLFLNVGSTTQGGFGLDAPGTFNTQVFNTTAINAKLNGFNAVTGDASATGGGLYSFFCTNCLATLNDTTGFTITAQDTWTVTNANAFGNGTNYTPSSHANYNPSDTPSAVDPEMASCYLWAPDASAADTNDWGAEILYRYQNGVLQDGTGGTVKTPLWDPTTNEFPHGAIIAGVNDVAGSSLFDVHERLHVGTANGCAFPASYTGGGAPANPAGQVTSQGTTSPSHVRTVTASKEALTAGIALYDSGANVGTVTGVTSSCGSEALTQVGTAVTSPAYRRVYLFRRLNPTAGASCTITATTTGTVTASVLISNEYDDVAAFGTAVTATGLSGIPAVTASVASDAGNIIVDMLASKCGLSAGECTTSLTATGTGQTLQGDQGHLTLGDLRGASSEKSSTDGGDVAYVTGNNYWAMVAVPMCAVSCDALTHVLTQSASRVDDAFMVNCPGNCTVVNLGAVNAASVDISVGRSFAVSLQTDSTVAAVPTAGRKLYVSYNSGAYVPMTDTVTNHLSFHGSTADPTVVSGAVSVNLSGVLTNVPGTTIHSVSVTPSATMTQDDSLVNRWVLKLAADAVATDTFEFREYTDAGVALDAYGATADAKITVTGTTPDIQAPTGLKLVSNSNTLVSLIWTPSTYATLAGYRVYQSTDSGVYGEAVETITPASAAAVNSTPTQFSVQTLIGDTYYFVVTAFDQDGNESAVSNEVTAVQTGFTARSASTGGAATARTASTGRDLRGVQAP